MAYKIKIDSKKRLKEPDEFVSIMESVVSFVKENLKYLGILLAIILVFALAYGAIIIKTRIDDDKAAGLEYAASRHYFGTGMEREGRDLKKAIEVYQKIISDYKRSKSAPTAAYYLGNAYMELKEYDAAIGAYKGFIDRYADRRDLIPFVYQRLGYAYLAKGNNQNALDNFNKVAIIETVRNRDQSIFESARILELMGKKDEALKKYEEIIRDFPSSVFSAEAEVKIKALGGDQGAQEPKKNDQKNKK